MRRCDKAARNRELNMKTLALTSLLFALLLVSSTTYSRLQYAGIGCTDWPACYGQVAATAQQEAPPRIRATTMLAGALSMLVLAMTVVTMRSRRHRFISVAALTVTALLTWQAFDAVTIQSPAMLLGSICGGFLLVGLLGWAVFRDARPHANASFAVRYWVLAALLLLCVQIVLGGLTSANFAATACQSLPDCNGSWWPGSDLWPAFDLTRDNPLEAERTAIHQGHRLTALLTLVVALVAGVHAYRARLSGAAVAVVALAGIEFGIGVAAIATDLPMRIAVAHNVLAAILLLGLLRLLALCRNRQALL